MKNKKRKSVGMVFVLGIVIMSSFMSLLFFRTANAIIDGTEYPESAYPNVARLFDKNGDDFCTGTLIDPNHIITAAHCFFNNGTTHQRDIFSNEISARINGSYYRSKAIYIHSTYKGEYHAAGAIDVAIIELDKNVTGITPAALLTTPFPLKTDLIIAGYGLVGCGGDSWSESQMHAPALGKIYAGTTEFDWFGSWIHSGVKQDSNGDYAYLIFDTCDANTASGDSGGPAFYDKKLAAITSGGSRSSTTIGLRSLSLRIDKIIPWIQDVLSGKIQPTPDLPDSPGDPSEQFLVYDYEGLKYTFANAAIINGNKIYFDAVEYNSDRKDDGTYNLMVFPGIYATNSAMAFYESDLKNSKRIATLYKKKGDSKYLGQLNVKLKIGPFANAKTGNAYKIALRRDEVGNYNSPEPLVDPGEYVISIFVDGRMVVSTDICLPSFTSETGIKIGDVVCPEKSTPKSNTVGNSDSSLLVTIGSPIFITGAHNDIAQFNVPLRYDQFTNPNNKSKVTGSLQTVIYKKNESKKVEDTASLSQQNILYNTQSLYSYQWSGLVPGNEYVAYFYDKATGSKSSYISLKYGSDGKIAAVPVSSLPAWASVLVVTSSDDQHATYTSTATGANGVSVTFVMTKALVDEVAKTLSLEGTLAYSRALTGSEQVEKVDTIAATIYDSIGSVYKTKKMTVIKLDPAGKTINVTLTLDNIDPAKAATFIVKDTDFTVSSDLFALGRKALSSEQLVALYAAQSATSTDGTTVTLGNPVITAGPDATSIVVMGTVTYGNPEKTGKVPNASIVARLRSINAQGNLVDDNAGNGRVSVTLAPNYNQSTAISAAIGNLDPMKKYAVQFAEENYAPAASLAKAIESKEGKFVESLSQPGTGTGDSNQNPGSSNGGGRGGLGSPLKDGLNSVPGIIAIVVDDVVIPIAIPLLALAIMYTGFLFVKARGNATALEEAKKALKWTLIGGAIILASKVISLVLSSTIADIVRKP